MTCAGERLPSNGVPIQRLPSSGTLARHFEKVPVDSAAHDRAHDRRDNVNGEEATSARAGQGDRSPPGEERKQPGTKVPRGVEARLGERGDHEIKAATVKPMKTAARPAGGADVLPASVTANTTIAKINVPSTSARNAAGSGTNEFNRS